MLNADDTAEEEPNPYVFASSTGAGIVEVVVEVVEVEEVEEVDEVDEVDVDEVVEVEVVDEVVDVDEVDEVVEVDEVDVVEVDEVDVELPTVVCTVEVVEVDVEVVVVVVMNMAIMLPFVADFAVMDWEVVELSIMLPLKIHELKAYPLGGCADTMYCTPLMNTTMVLGGYRTPSTLTCPDTGVVRRVILLIGLET